MPIQKFSLPYILIEY